MLSRGRVFKIFLGLAVSAGLLAYLFWDVDLQAIGRRLAATRWEFLAASIGLNLVSIWVRARRWHYLFPPGSRPSHLFNAVMIGYMGNNLLPLRAGELVRVYVVARRGQPFWTALATLIVERVLDVLALGVILAGLVLVIPIPAELQWAALLFVGADLAIIAILALIAVAPGRCRRLVEFLSTGRPWLRARLSKILATFTEGLRGVRAASHVGPIVAWSVVIWVAWAAAAWAGLRAVHLELPMAAAWAVLAFVGLGVSLPSSPAFAGVIQAAAVLALAIFGVPRADALSFSLLLHASQFFPVTLWGLSLLLVEHVSLSEASRSVEAPVAPPPG